MNSISISNVRLQHYTVHMGINVIDTYYIVTIAGTNRQSIAYSSMQSNTKRPQSDKTYENTYFRCFRCNSKFTLYVNDPKARLSSLPPTCANQLLQNQQAFTPYCQITVPYKPLDN